MTRIIQKPEVLAAAWGSFCRLNTAAGPRDFRLVLRGPTNYAAKAIPLWRADGAPWGDVNDVFAAINLIGPRHIRTLILAADRPLGYLECFDVASNLQFELPGGMVDPGEEEAQAAVRENCEESGIAPEAIAGCAQLFPNLAVSAGSAPEMYSAYVVLCNTPARPPKRDGVYPQNCIECSLHEALPRLLQLQAASEAVEMLAYTAHLALRARLRGLID